MRSPRIRFVFRLAVVLGIADPIAWMDSKPPEVIDRWIVYCAENPLPDSWMHAATIAAEIYGATMWIAAKCGETIEPRSVPHWIPNRTPQPSTRMMTADESRRWIHNQTGI